MIGQVDTLLKKRKESCARLTWEIAELENQLEYAKKTSREYKNNSGTENGLLNSCDTQLMSLRTTMERFRTDWFMPCKDLKDELLSVFERGQFCLHRTAYNCLSSLISAQECYDLVLKDFQKQETLYQILNEDICNAEMQIERTESIHEENDETIAKLTQTMSELEIDLKVCIS